MLVVKPKYSVVLIYIMQTPLTVTLEVSGCRDTRAHMLSCKDTSCLEATAAGGIQDAESVSTSKPRL